MFEHPRKKFDWAGVRHPISFYLGGPPPETTSENRMLGPTVGQHRWNFNEGAADMAFASAKLFCLECKRSDSLGPQDVEEMKGTEAAP